MNAEVNKTARALWKKEISSLTVIPVVGGVCGDVFWQLSGTSGIVLLFLFPALCHIVFFPSLAPCFSPAVGTEHTLTVVVVCVFHPQARRHNLCIQNSPWWDWRDQGNASSHPFSEAMRQTCISIHTFAHYCPLEASISAALLSITWTTWILSELRYGKMYLATFNKYKYHCITKQVLTPF